MGGSQSSPAKGTASRGSRADSGPVAAQQASGADVEPETTAVLPDQTMELLSRGLDSMTARLEALKTGFTEISADKQALLKEEFDALPKPDAFPAEVAAEAANGSQIGTTTSSLSTIPA